MHTIPQYDGLQLLLEKENLSSADAHAELMYTVLCSFAQEESHSISENVLWGWIRRMERGEVTIPYKNFLGYQKGPDGKPQIVEEEAAIVREIFQLYIDGWTFQTIAHHLTDRGIPTPSGKKTWTCKGIHNILSNEKYKGDALLQKTYTKDFLSKKICRNNGERKQYYVEDSHECCPYVNAMNTPKKPENRAFLGDLRMHTPVISAE